MSCEDAIADLEFESDDDPEELEMKMALLEIYNSRLERRRHIKKFVVDHKLHNRKYQSKKNLGRSRKHRELHSKMKKFLQVMTNEEYDEFVSDLAEEKELVKRICELQEYRTAGITTFKESFAHKAERKASREAIVRK